MYNFTLIKTHFMQTDYKQIYGLPSCCFSQKVLEYFHTSMESSIRAMKIKISVIFIQFSVSSMTKSSWTMVFLEWVLLDQVSLASCGVEVGRSRSVGDYLQWDSFHVGSCLSSTSLYVGFHTTPILFSPGNELPCSCSLLFSPQG